MAEISEMTWELLKGIGWSDDEIYWWAEMVDGVPGITLLIAKMMWLDLHG